MKAFIQTYGCQMNEHDSQRMMAVLASVGYEMTADIHEASLILVNTCSVRHNPENKVYSFLGTLHPLKRDNPNLIVGVAGCVAQQAGGAILKRNADVDMVFGPDQFFRLPQMIEAVRGGERVVRTDWAPREPKTQNFIPDQWLEAGHVENRKAYIAITKGCDNFCSFCIVPYTRGREISRRPDNILREAQALIDKGAREIWLLGQNVNSYNADGYGFHELLEAMAQLPLSRLRFTSPHPRDWNNALSDLMAAQSVICNQLHLPLQSGSDRVLELMNRRHGIRDYLEKVAYAKSVNPAIEISTDLIVGFPTETEEDFACTLDVLDQVRYSQVFSFMYSPRPGTRAEKLDDDVPRDVKEERLQQLIALQNRINQEQLENYLGTTQELLIDGAHPRKDHTVSGRTDGFRPVSVTDPALGIGDLVDVRITGYHGHWLEGERLYPLTSSLEKEELSKKKPSSATSSLEKEELSKKKSSSATVRSTIPFGQLGKHRG